MTQRPYLSAEDKIADDLWRLRVASEALIYAYVDRWVRVNCTPAEERTLRELNDLLNEIGDRDAAQAATRIGVGIGVEPTHKD